MEWKSEPRNWWNEFWILTPAASLGICRTLWFGFYVIWYLVSSVRFSFGCVLLYLTVVLCGPKSLALNFCDPMYFCVILFLPHGSQLSWWFCPALLFHHGITFWCSSARMYANTLASLLPTVKEALALRSFMHLLVFVIPVPMVLGWRK